MEKDLKEISLLENPRTVFFFIHGAWASPASFNYLISKLEDKYPTTVFGYDCQTQTINEVISAAKNHLFVVTKPTDKVIVVGHSLGGLIAVSLEKEERVSQVVTLASPLSGIKINRMLEWFLAYKAPVIHSIATHSNFLADLHSSTYTKPINILMSTAGFNPTISEPNDGVIPLSSQDTWVPHTAIINFIHANHFEILQHEDTLIELDHIGEQNGRI